MNVAMVVLVNMKLPPFGNSTVLALCRRAKRPGIRRMEYFAYSQGSILGYSIRSRRKLRSSKGVTGIVMAFPVSKVWYRELQVRLRAVAGRRGNGQQASQNARARSSLAGQIRCHWRIPAARRA